ncbi:sulfotransferase [uncultured Shimia sp.]|uniref:sulfotransferase n=1 Tax=uncultured Shimia sp. TaxID=573152 RepID=UPI0026032FE3|nr:sulfotransferase [uncultured Shimia sp.]
MPQASKQAFSFSQKPRDTKGKVAFGQFSDFAAPPDDALKVAFSRTAISGSGESVALSENAASLRKSAIQLMRKVDADPLSLPKSLLQKSQWRSALPLYVAFLEANPDSGEALNGLGHCLLGLGNTEKALAAFAEAVQQAPTNPIYTADLGEAFEATGQLVVALECFAIAQKLTPNEPSYVLRNARVLHALGQLELGVQLLEVSVEAWPEDPDITGCYASLLEAVGRSEDALVQWQRALEQAPENSVTYANFVAFRRPSEMAGFEEKLDAQLAQRNAKSDESRLRSAKVAALEERGDYEAAYRNLQIANRRSFEMSDFDIAREERLFESLKAQFVNPSVIEIEELDATATPIFILGLPRSGSSLTETIIGRHSDVTQAGELDYLAPLVKRLDLLSTPLELEQAVVLRERYLTLLSQSGSGRFITDKMPLNFRLIGHIATAMPQARIVHVYRDPKACCWSNFRHFFAGEGLGFTNDTKSLIRYFELYQDLMAFWHERFPERIIDVDYEALVADPDAQIPQLIQLLGLDWQDACLAPQDSANVVRTASQEQVRQKIYKGSALGWRKYEVQAGGWLSRLPDHQPIGG